MMARPKKSSRPSAEIFDYPFILWVTHQKKQKKLVSLGQLIFADTETGEIYKQNGGGIQQESNFVVDTDRRVTHSQKLPSLLLKLIGENKKDAVELLLWFSQKMFAKSKINSAIEHAQIKIEKNSDGTLICGMSASKFYKAAATLESFDVIKRCNDGRTVWINLALLSKGQRMTDLIEIAKAKNSKVLE